MDRVCSYPRITDLMEVLIQIGNGLGKQEQDSVSAELIAGMLKRIRNQVIPNLMQGDYTRCT